MTGLALLPDWTLASVSHDRTIRLWDLHTFKLMTTVKDAHETPLQGIDYCPDREEFVTWAMDNFAYVWDAVHATTKYALVGHTAELTQVGALHSCPIFETSAMQAAATLLYTNWAFSTLVVTAACCAVVTTPAVDTVLLACTDKWGVRLTQGRTTRFSASLIVTRTDAA